MVNSIEKGKRFEREIARLLSYETGVKWYRVPQSGGMVSRGLTEQKYKGDVFTEDKQYGHLTIECKINKKVIMLSDLINRKGLLYSWINQAENEGRYWILFFKDGSHNIYAVSREVTIMNVHTYKEYEQDSVRFVLLEHLGTRICKVDNRYDLYIINKLPKNKKNNKGVHDEG